MPALVVEVGRAVARRRCTCTRRVAALNAGRAERVRVVDGVGVRLPAAGAVALVLVDRTGVDAACRGTRPIVHASFAVQ